MLSYLRSQHAVTSLLKDFKIFPLLFKSDPIARVGGEITSNVKYALLFGHLTALKSPLVTLYDALDDLKTVVQLVCPPKVTIGVVCDDGLALVKVHSEDFDKKVTYFGGDSDLIKFKRKLDTDKSPVGTKQEESLDSASIPSTSTTPVKCPPCTFNDSGIDVGSLPL